MVGKPEQKEGQEISDRAFVILAVFGIAWIAWLFLEHVIPYSVWSIVLVILTLPGLLSFMMLVVFGLVLLYLALKGLGG